MPAQPLSDQQKLDAERLQMVWLAFKDANPEANQEKLAAECGWKTQGAVSQYMRGKIPLNLPALLKFSKALGVPALNISPTLAAQLPQPAVNLQKETQKQPLAVVTPAQTAINDIASAMRVIAVALAQADQSDRNAAKAYLVELCDRPEDVDTIAAKLQRTLVALPAQANATRQ